MTTTAALVTYLQSYFPDAPQSVVAGLVNLYPEDPSAGSPFGTGIFNQEYTGYKRIAAILGDITFTLTRRVALEILRTNTPSYPPIYSYLSSYYAGTPFLGTFHGSDITELFQ